MAEDRPGDGVQVWYFSAQDTSWPKSLAGIIYWYFSSFFQPIGIPECARCVIQGPEIIDDIIPRVVGIVDWLDR